MWRLRKRVKPPYQLGKKRTPAVDTSGRASFFSQLGQSPTGVELAGALVELARTTLSRDFRRIDPGQTRIVLIEAGPRVLAGFPRHLSHYAERSLRQMGIELQLGSPVERIDGREIDSSRVSRWGTR
jgi:NADH dehydrogenase